MQRELGGRRHLTGIVFEAEACGHRDELLRREPAQTVAQLLGCRHAQALELVGGLRPSLDRGAAGRAQGPDHLYGAVAALGHPRRFSGQNRPCGALGVRRVGLLEVTTWASPPVLGALHLQHLDSPGSQVPSEPGPVGAGTFYPDVPDGAKTLRPTVEPLVTLHGRWHARLAQAP